MNWPSRRRFEPDDASRAESSPHAAVLIDPEAYEASEEQFSASLGAPVAPARAKFIVEEAGEPPNQPGIEEDPAARQEAPAERANAILIEQPAALLPPDGPSPVETSFWKEAVAARVNDYRAKRKPRPPRYPSLRLKFEPPETRWQNAATDERPAEPVVVENPAPARSASERAPAAGEAAAVLSPQRAGTEPARIIEFPRSYPVPESFAYELAEPVIDRPRILEAPEIVTSPPVLGGIILENEEKEPERRPGFEIPVQAAPMTRRILAGATDAVIVLAASALFGYLFFRIVSPAPPLTQLLGMALAIQFTCWAGYQYLALVQTGTTPGLRVAGLRLCRFDGLPADRGLRRWRVAAAILSGVSLGLGFAWCFLDEDALCWHDRITCTYLAPEDRAKTRSA